MNIGNLASGIGSLFGGGKAAQAAETQNAQSDDNQARLTGAQMEQETKKTAAQIQQIKQETNTKVAEMFRESNLNKAKSASKIHNKWVQQIMA